MNSNWRSRLGAIFPPVNQPEPASFAPDFAAASEPVLVIDDDRDWASECAFALRALGYDPIIAGTPDEAVSLFLARPVEIAIVDYNMPGRDGITLSYELTRTAQEQGRKLYFIVATGFATKDIAVDAMRASAVDFLEKPIRQVDLRRALQRVKGLSDVPAAREVLLNTMSGLRSELQRLSQLMDDPGEPRTPPINPAMSPDSSHVILPLAPDFPETPPPPLTTYIRDLLKKEAKRRGIGGGEVFGDPAWEMLLDLMLAKIESRQVSVSSACIASGAPMSTALRLVGRLVEDGVLQKFPDERDRRRHFLAINPLFEQPLLEYLSDQLRKSGSTDAA